MDAQIDLAFLRSNLQVFSNDVPHTWLLEILDNEIIGVFLKPLTLPKFANTSFRIPIPDTETGIKVSGKQVKFKSVNFLHFRLIKV